LSDRAEMAWVTSGASEKTPGAVAVLTIATSVAAGRDQELVDGCEWSEQPAGP